MAFLFRPRGLGQLITCIVEREGTSWSVVWTSDGKVPRDFNDPSLGDAIDKASSQVAALYAGKPDAATAELQFAIYPWQGTSGKVILDVTREGSVLSVRDLQGTGIEFRTDSIQDAVQDAEKYLPNPNDAMLRWIRRVAEL